jgi:Icc-related predicted phosphoesterase
MKCLLVSDLHYALKQFDWIHSVADRFDLVVIAGDQLDVSSMVDVDVQIVVILKYLRRLKDRTRLLVSSGNHDLNGRNASGERAATWLSRARDLGVPIDGDHLEIDDISITVCPWWDGPESRDLVGLQLERDAQRRRRRWIWVYHAPPDESPVSWAGTKHFGDRDLLEWIRTFQPDIVLTGHIHQSPFRDGGSWVDQIGRTWIFNAGRQIGPRPTHVIFDTTDMKAMWFSLAGNQVVSLAAPLTRPLAELTELENSRP